MVVHLLQNYVFIYGLCFFIYDHCAFVYGLCFFIHDHCAFIYGLCTFHLWSVFFSFMIAVVSFMVCVLFHLWSVVFDFMPSIIFMACVIVCKLHTYNTIWSLKQTLKTLKKIINKLRG